jgi:hypothetical protein
VPQGTSLPAAPAAVAASARHAIASVAHSAGELPSTVRRHAPPRERMLYYAGLGTLAAVDVLSWPVAAAIGGGVWIASRSRRTATK